MMRPILLLLLSSGTGVAAQGLRAHRSLQMSLAEDPEPAQAVPEAAAAAPMSAAAAFGLSTDSFGEKLMPFLSVAADYTSII